MRGVVPELMCLFREFGSVARFVMIYIKEAHAQDVWPISSARHLTPLLLLSFFPFFLSPTPPSLLCCC